jgi:hypothetical protein
MIGAGFIVFMLGEWEGFASSHPTNSQIRAWHEKIASLCFLVPGTNLRIYKLSPMRQGLGGLGPKDGSGSGPHSGLTA